MSKPPKLKTLFMTGASGFIGGHLLRSLASSHAFSRIYLVSREPARLKLQISALGFAARDSIFEVIEGRESDWGLSGVKPTHVLHLAGIRQGRSWEEFERVHVSGTRKLFQQLRGKERVVVLSCQSALGAGPGPTPRGDFDAEFPIGWEAQSKLDMERMIEQEFGRFNYLVLRPSMVVGSGDHLGRSVGPLRRWPLSFKLGAEAKNYSFIAINDLIDAILRTLLDERDWRTWQRRVFHVASDEVVSDTDILSFPRVSDGKGGIVIGVPQKLVRTATRWVDRSTFLRRQFPLLVPNRFRELTPHWWLAKADRFSETFQWFPKVDFQEAMKQSLNSADRVH